MPKSNRSYSEKIKICKRNIERYQIRLDCVKLSEYCYQLYKLFFYFDNNTNISVMQKRIDKEKKELTRLIEKTKALTLISGRMCMIAKLMKAFKPETKTEIDKIIGVQYE